MGMMQNNGRRSRRHLSSIHSRSACKSQVHYTLAFLLALLVQTGAIQLWHVYILAALLGIVNALDMPAQQAFVGDLVGMAQVRKAVVINTALVQLSRSVGPALAGWVIGSLSVATAFWLNGLSFVAVVISLLAVRSEQVRRPSSGTQLGEFREGLRFMSGQPRIQDVIMFTILTTFFGLSNIQLLPVFATQVLHGRAEALGLLLGASGAGALVGSLVVAPLVQRFRLSGVVIGGAVCWVGVWFAAFSFSTWLPLSMFCLFCTGLGNTVVVTTVIGLLQVLAPPTMRARLQSILLMVTFGTQPLAVLLVGYSATLVSAPITVLVNGLLMIAGAFLLLTFRSGLRTWEAPSANSNREWAHARLPVEEAAPI